MPGESKKPLLLLRDSEAPICSAVADGDLVLVFALVGLVTKEVLVAVDELGLTAC